MTFSNVIEKIKNKDYESKLPYPEYNSDLSKEEIKEMKQRIWEDNKRLREEFENDLYKEACLELNGEQMVKFSKEKFKKIIDYAWQEGHSSGYCEINIIFLEIFNLIKEFL